MPNNSSGSDPDAAPREPLTAFAREVAHEIRNSLNNIALAVQHLELTLKPPDETVTRILGRLRREIERLTQLAKELPERARNRSE